jgi:hypothetical protein
VPEPVKAQCWFCLKEFPDVIRHVKEDCTVARHAREGNKTFVTFSSVGAIKWKSDNKTEKFVDSVGYILGFALLFGLPLLALISWLCGWDSL